MLWIGGFELTKGPLRGCPKVRMDAREIWRMENLQLWPLRRDKEDIATADGVDVNGCENRPQCFFERGHQEIFSFVEIAKAINDKCSLRFEHASECLKRLAAHEVRGRGITQKRIEDGGV